MPWLADRDSRSCGRAQRDHLGVDIMLETCTPVIIPPGCHIIMNGDTPIWGKWEGGYGYYMRFRCNESVEVRYAHIHGYDATSQTVINGYSGAAVEGAPHVHYEIYADDGIEGVRATDPECVWGESDVATCCRGVSGTCLLGNGPADMCNPTVRRQLSENHSARHRRNGECNQPVRGYTSNDPIAAGVSPDQVPGGMHMPSDVPPGCGSGSTHTPGTPLTTVIDDEDPGTPDVIVYPEGALTPMDEPGPPPSGTPGGEADLTPSTSSSGVDVSGCAADTWTAMVNQAVLEARREIIVNNRLIAKSDSVLTYTCFDDQVRYAATQAGPIFSETSDWVNRDVDLMGKTVTISRELGSDSLDGSLTMLVDQMAAPYLTQNFSHGLLGETAGSISVPGGGCAVMDTVWQAAKCKDADDHFYTFQELVTSRDPRNVPASLACGGP